ncbi:MAG: hypothetical protein K0R36_2121 [Chryseobacterium sp.]|jgi:hypothetical protein|nr:hypothetical protein [Chryseobacterium sp.]
MKYLLVFIMILFISCRKAETQYINDDNKKSTVNDKRSDTIKTLPDATQPTVPDSTHIKPDTED